LERVDVVQPVSWAVMVSLAALWESVGVVPDAVIGHSQGEIAAACVAGGLSLADGARVVVLRSQAILRELSGLGGMVSIRLGIDEASSLVEKWAGHIEIAAVNGPAAVVVAGEPDALHSMMGTCEERGVRARRIPVDYASHTSHVERIELQLRETLSSLDPRSSQIPFYSTVDNEWVDTGRCDATYWYRNLRQTVRFDPAVRALTEQGYRAFVEVSAHPVLTMSVQDVLDAQARTPTVVSGTLRRDEGGPRRFLTSLAELHVRGVPADWETVFAAMGARRVNLPTYAFQRQRYWLEEHESSPAADKTIDEADTRFWDAVQREDLDLVMNTLEIDAEDQHSAQAMGAALGLLSSWRRRRQEGSTVDQLRYKVVWKPVTDVAGGVPPGSWLVVVPEGYTAEDRIVRLLGALETQGLRTVILEVGQVDADRTSLCETVRTVLAGNDDISGVLSLLALDRRVRPESAGLTEGAAATLALVQGLGDAGAGQPLWCVTRGAVSIGPVDHLEAPDQSLTWGLGRAIALEYPTRWAGLVDLPEDLDDRAVQRLLGVLHGPTDEDQVAVRSTGVFVRRLRRAPLSSVASTREWQPRGTVLVTGGTEGLGRHAAKWLASAGAEHLVLTVDSNPQAPDVQALLGELETKVTLVATDMSNRDAVAELLAGLAGEPPLTAVVHAVDLVRTGPIDSTGIDDLARVLSAKVDPVVHLDELLGDRPLDMFAVFSSIAGVWGGGGQGMSAAANAFLDAVAEQRRARGMTAISVAWGAIDEIGVGADAATQEQLRRRGVLPIPPELAITALERAIRGDETFVTVADIQWPTFAPAFTSMRSSPLISDLPDTRLLLRTTGYGEDSGEADSALVRSLIDASESEQERILLKLVRSHAATALGHNGIEAISPQRAFQEVGFDSLAAVSLRNSLGAAVGLSLPATLIFDYPTPAAVVDYVRAQILEKSEEVDAKEQEDAVRRLLASVSIARLREAGVLDLLLQLASSHEDDTAQQEPVVNDDAELIDAMDVDSLVQRALGSTQS
jgi:rifamycin polyketide synthase module 1/2/3